MSMFFEGKRKQATVTGTLLKPVAPIGGCPWPQREPSTVYSLPTYQNHHPFRRGLFPGGKRKLKRRPTRWHRLDYRFNRTKSPDEKKTLQQPEESDGGSPDPDTRPTSATKEVIADASHNAPLARAVTFSASKLGLSLTLPIDTNKGMPSARSLPDYPHRGKDVIFVGADKADREDDEVESAAGAGGSEYAESTFREYRPPAVNFNRARCDVPRFEELPQRHPRGVEPEGSYVDHWAGVSTEVAEVVSPDSKIRPLREFSTPRHYDEVTDPGPWNNKKTAKLVEDSSKERQVLRRVGKLPTVYVCKDDMIVRVDHVPQEKRNRQTKDQAYIENLIKEGRSNREKMLPSVPVERVETPITMARRRSQTLLTSGQVNSLAHVSSTVDGGIQMDEETGQIFAVFELPNGMTLDLKAEHDKRKKALEIEQMKARRMMRRGSAATEIPKTPGNAPLTPRGGVRDSQGFNDDHPEHVPSRMHVESHYGKSSMGDDDSRVTGWKQGSSGDNTNHLTTRATSRSSNVSNSPSPGNSKSGTASASKDTSARHSFVNKDGHAPVPTYEEKRASEYVTQYVNRSPMASAVRFPNHPINWAQLACDFNADNAQNVAVLSDAVPQKPEHKAVFFYRNEIMSDVMNLSDAFMNYLGIQHGTVVAFCGDVCPDMYFSFIACTAIGATSTFLDPSMPMIDMTRCIRATKPRFFIITVEMVDFICRVIELYKGHVDVEEEWNEPYVIVMDPWQNDIEQSIKDRHPNRILVPFENVEKVMGNHEDIFDPSDLLMYIHPNLGSPAWKTTYEEYPIAITFSRGSTGNPRLCSFSHANLVAGTQQMMFLQRCDIAARREGADSDEEVDTTCGITDDMIAMPIHTHFDISTAVYIAATIANGGRAILKPARGSEFIHVFQALEADVHPVTHLHITHPAYALALAREKANYAVKNSFKGLQQVLVGYGPIPSELVAEMNLRFKCGIREMFTMAESCSPVFVTAKSKSERPRRWPPRKKDMKRQARHAKLLHDEHFTGSALPGVEAIVVDSSMDSAPYHLGEVVIRGPQLASALLGKAAKRGLGFLVEKVARDSDGWVKTGDIGFFGLDQSITTLERAKPLVVRGAFEEVVKVSVIEEAIKNGNSGVAVDHCLVQHTPRSLRSVYIRPEMRQRREEVEAFVMLKRNVTTTHDDDNGGFRLMKTVTPVSTEEIRSGINVPSHGPKLPKVVDIKIVSSMPRFHGGVSRRHFRKLKGAIAGDAEFLRSNARNPQCVRP